MVNHCSISFGVFGVLQGIKLPKNAQKFAAQKTIFWPPEPKIDVKFLVFECRALEYVKNLSLLLKNMLKLVFFKCE